MKFKVILQIDYNTDGLDQLESLKREDEPLSQVVAESISNLLRDADETITSCIPIMVEETSLGVEHDR